MFCLKKVSCNFMVNPKLYYNNYQYFIYGYKKFKKLKLIKIASCPPFFLLKFRLKLMYEKERTHKIEKRNNKMKKTILIFIMLLAYCLVTGAVFADTYHTNQMSQPPMGGPQMNGGQDGQMQSQPPMNLAVIDADEEAVRLFTEADTDSDVLETIENGAVVEILEEDGDYLKVSVKGTIGYILKSELSELKPSDGQEPPAKPEDGSEPPAKPEDGSEPPAKPENGQQPPAKLEDGSEPPAKPENGQQLPAKPENGSEPPAKPENGQQMPGQPDNPQPMPSQPLLGSAEKQNSALEPGLGNFFQAFLNFLTGKNANNQK